MLLRGVFGLSTLILCCCFLLIFVMKKKKKGGALAEEEERGGMAGNSYWVSFVPFAFVTLNSYFSDIEKNNPSS